MGKKRENLLSIYVALLLDYLLCFTDVFYHTVLISVPL